jgi:hypothetical protein
MSQCFNSELPIGPPGPTGPVGPAGSPGSVWRSGNGAPSNSLGVNGDFYLDTSTGDVYQKISGAYNFQINIEGDPGNTGAASTVPGPPGTNGNTLLNGTVPPTSGDGVNGDFYIDTNANEIYGPKTGGSWGVGTPLIGPQGPSGSSGSLVERYYDNVVIASANSPFTLYSQTLPLSNDLLFPTDKSSIVIKTVMSFRVPILVSKDTSFDLDFGLDGGSGNVQIYPNNLGTLTQAEISSLNYSLIRTIPIDYQGFYGYLTFTTTITRVGGNDYSVFFEWQLNSPYSYKRFGCFQDSNNPGSLGFTSSDFTTITAYGYANISNIRFFDITTTVETIN